MAELSTHEIEAAVNELEIKIERLRILYEQYFIGILKREPTVQLKDVVRVQRILDSQHLKNSSLRFRFRGAVQKFNSYRNYWKRTMRQIEQGTYRRDLARVKRSYAKKGIELPDLSKLRTSAAVERALADATASSGSAKQKPAEKARQPATAVTPPPIPPPPKEGMLAASASTATQSSEQMQSLYRRFVKAKKMCGEDTSTVQYEALARTIDRQLPKLKQKYGDREFDFQVVIRDGRTILKAKPK